MGRRVRSEAQWARVGGRVHRSDAAESRARTHARDEGSARIDRPDGTSRIFWWGGKSVRQTTVPTGVLEQLERRRR
jgi:hypothetical protein